MGAVLSEEFADREHPIASASRSLTKAELNYTITEKECLAVLIEEALRVWVKIRRSLLISEICRVTSSAYRIAVTVRILVIDINKIRNLCTMVVGADRIR